MNYDEVAKVLRANKLYSVYDTIEIVGAYFGIDPFDKSQKALYCEIRAAIYIILRDYGYNDKVIGEIFNKDRSTVYADIIKFSELRKKQERDFYPKYEKINKIFQLFLRRKNVVHTGQAQEDTYSS